jgi:cytochrome c biogenesis factor
VVFLLGVAGVASGGTETVALHAGERARVHGVDVVLERLRVVDGPPTAVVADVRVDGHAMAPSLVAHPDHRIVLPETALRSSPIRDLQVALRNADDTTALLEVGVHPLQQLVWWGGLLTIAAGATALRSRDGERLDHALVSVGLPVNWIGHEAGDHVGAGGQVEREEL